ncbi:cellulose biosynthesis cyclic di-GMP-binding regulatory protein BcsB [Candidatus Woesearchaeota archaeon]|nr:cellulose biosynthesis cyclic di-GMP-binding regulatory protein BcsB [Candidatus Woesearchaeota archaeon]
MEKGVILIAGISLFLMLLFLVGVGPVITGNVIKNPSEVSLADFPYPFIKNNAYNQLTIVVPENPSKEEAQAALAIADIVRQSRDFNPPILSVKKDTHKGNRILVGMPCKNPEMQKKLGTNACDVNLPEAKGMLSLTHEKYGLTLIVTGSDARGLQNAAAVLANADFYPLAGEKILVEGSGKALSLSIEE